MLLWFVHNEKDQDHIEFYLHFLYPVLSHFVEVRYLISQQAPLKWMLVNSKICHICHESKIIRCEKWRTKCMRRYHLKICLTSNTNIFTLQIIFWLQFDCEEGCASHMDEGRLQLLISNGSWHIYSTDVHHVVCCIASDLTQKHFVLKHVRLTSVFGSLWFLSQSHQSHKITILSLWKSLGFANIQLADTIVLAGSSPKLYHPCFFHFSQQSFINLLSSWINCWGFQSLQWWCRGPSSPGLTLSSSWRRVRRRWSSGRGFQLNSQSWSPCRAPRGRQSWQCRQSCSSSPSFWTACCMAPWWICWWLQDCSWRSCRSQIRLQGPVFCCPTSPCATGCFCSD